jgi:hypothetical protein
MKKVMRTIGHWFGIGTKANAPQKMKMVGKPGHGETKSPQTLKETVEGKFSEQKAPEKEVVVMEAKVEVEAEVEMIEKSQPEQSNEAEFPELSVKQNWMVAYLRAATPGTWTSPSQVGREYGKSKGKDNWGSQHSSKTLLGLVKKGYVERNDNGHYRAK